MKLPNINREKIFMWGHSMGGEVTLRVIEVTDKVKAASLWAPAITHYPENTLYFARRDPTRAARRLAEYEAEFGEVRGEKVATLDNLEYVKVPVIVQHATGDESVPYEWGEEVTDRLQGQGVNVTLYTYQGDNHNIAANFALAIKRDTELFR